MSEANGTAAPAAAPAPAAPAPAAPAPAAPAAAAAAAAPKPAAAAPAAAAAAAPKPAAAAAATPKAAAAGDAKPAATDAAAKPASPGNFKENFKAFSKFGDTKSDGKLITLSQSDKWMKQAGVIDGKKITTTDTGIYFKKFKSLKISQVDYDKFIEELAKSKKVEAADLKSKMAACGAPGHTGTSNKAKQAGQSKSRPSTTNK